MAVRSGLPLERVSPFLRSKLCPEVATDAAHLDALVADILDISRKPAMGAKPRYFKEASKPLPFWGSSAQIVARYFVEHTEHGGSFDPQVTLEELQAHTGLPEEDVRIGLLDLTQAGLIERDPCYGSTLVWPRRALFVEFDAAFTGHDPEEDAVAVANYLYNRGIEDAELTDIGKALNWEPRRLNPAIAFLVDGGVVDAHEYSSGDSYEPAAIGSDDRLLRFVRDTR
jgi:hypothetical protein